MTADQIFAILQIVLQMMGNLTTNAAVQSVVNIIEKFLPEIEQAEATTVKAFQNVIADLTGGPSLTAAQMQTLLTAKAALDARTDADIAKTLGTSGSAP